MENNNFSEAGVPPPPNFSKPQPPPPPPHYVESELKPKKSNGGIVSFLGGCFSGCLVAILLPVICIIILCGGISKAVKNVEFDDDCKGEYCKDDKSLTKVVVSGDEYDDAEYVVATIKLDGVIMLDTNENTFRPLRHTAAHALKAIKQAAKSKVDVIILSINSPGGGVTDSDIIYNELMKYRKNGGKVVVVMGDMCCSGGYYIAAAADKIIAHPTTITGSIGVIMNMINAKELADKIGVKSAPIVSGANKAIGDPLQELTQEQRAIFQNVVDTMYGRFVKLVANGRNKSEEDVRKIADGRIFTADDALQEGLIDKIGYHEDAFCWPNEWLGGEENYIVIRYKEESNFLNILGGNDIFGISTFLEKLENKGTEKKLMYRF